MKIRFLSSNKFKLAEVGAILGPIGVEIIPLGDKIEELQTDNMEALIRDKCIKAYHLVGRPLFVEHTGLEITALGGFPGGLTQLFWDKLQADRVASLFGGLDDAKVEAITRLAYCDGKKIHHFSGQISGTIAPEPKGSRDFQWDCIFIPSGYKETFAEMGARKNEISMRRIALDRFASFLKETSDAKTSR